MQKSNEQSTNQTKYHASVTHTKSVFKIVTRLGKKIALSLLNFTVFASLNMKLKPLNHVVLLLTIRGRQLYRKRERGDI